MVSNPGHFVIRFYIASAFLRQSRSSKTKNKLLIDVMKWFDVTIFVKVGKILWAPCTLHVTLFYMNFDQADCTDNVLLQH